MYTIFLDMKDINVSGIHFFLHKAFPNSWEGLDKIIFELMQLGLALDFFTTIM